MDAIVKVVNSAENVNKTENKVAEDNPTIITQDNHTTDIDKESKPKAKNDKKRKGLKKENLIMSRAQT